MILDTAFALFRQFGIRRVTMDDIARELRISKKTIYRHFPDKEAMVNACADRLASEVMPAVQAALVAEGRVTDRLSRALQALGTVPRMISSQFLADVRSDYPQVWQRIDDRRRGVIAHFEQLINDGIDAGDIRPEVHPKVALRVIFAVAERVLVPEVLAAGEFTPSQAFATISTMFTRGVLTRTAETTRRASGRPVASRRRSVKEARR
jgi:AcrR family transcriptional regulator